MTSSFFIRSTTQPYLWSNGKPYPTMSMKKRKAFSSYSAALSHFTSCIGLYKDAEIIEVPDDLGIVRASGKDLGAVVEKIKGMPDGSFILHFRNKLMADGVLEAFPWVVVILPKTYSYSTTPISDALQKALRGIGIKKNEFRRMETMFAFATSTHAMMARMTAPDETMIVNILDPTIEV